MDTWLLDFIAHNNLTIVAALALLKGFAKITPWDGDDRIVETLTGAFKALNPLKRKTHPAEPVRPERDEEP